MVWHDLEYTQREGLLGKPSWVGAGEIFTGMTPGNGAWARVQNRDMEIINREELDLPLR